MSFGFYTFTKQQQSVKAIFDDLPSKLVASVQMERIEVHPHYLTRVVDTKSCHTDAGGSGDETVIFKVPPSPQQPSFKIQSH